MCQDKFGSPTAFGASLLLALASAALVSAQNANPAVNVNPITSTKGHWYVWLIVSLTGVVFIAILFFVIRGFRRLKKQRKLREIQGPKGPTWQPEPDVEMGAYFTQAMDAEPHKTAYEDGSMPPVKDMDHRHVSSGVDFDAERDRRTGTHTKLKLTRSGSM
jgi:hypothetical protein